MMVWNIEEKLLKGCSSEPGKKGGVWIIKIEAKHVTHRANLEHGHPSSINAKAIRIHVVTF